ncbi:MAG: hypothetical protein V3T30_04725, partial [Thermodesulfobacteriota bacterium]
MKDRRPSTFRNLLLAFLFFTVFFSINKSKQAEANVCVVDYECETFYNRWHVLEYGVYYKRYNCGGFVDEGNKNFHENYIRRNTCIGNDMSYTVVEDSSCNQCMAETKTGKPPCPEINVGSSANYESGNLYDEIDLDFNKHFRVSYNSLDPTVGPFGRGFTHTYNSSVGFFGPGDHILRYVGGDGSVVKFYKKRDGRYFPMDPGRVGSYMVVTPTGFAMRIKNGLVSEFDLNGKLTKITDRNGNITTLSYDALGNLIKVTDKNNRSLIINIDPMHGKIHSIMGPNGHLYYFIYTGDFLTEIKAPIRTPIRYYTYNAAGLIETKTEPLGGTTYTYDAQNRLLTATDQDGRSTTMTYDLPNPAGYSSGVNNTVSITGKNGGLQTYTYKDMQRGPLFEVDALGNTTAFEYDSKGLLIKETAANGAGTTYKRDGANNIRERTDALGNLTIYTYNKFGAFTSATDALGNTTNMTYDASGNLLTVADALGNETNFQYDAAGNTISISDVLGNMNTMTYDGQNNLVTTTTPLGETTTFTYDVEGNVASRTNALGETSAFTYSPRNLLISRSNPGGNTTSFTYDAEMNKTSFVDANGNAILYEYNNDGKLLSTTDAAGGVTTYSYFDTGGCAGCGGGGEDELASFTDANGNTTTYSYDLMGRLVMETDALGAETHYGYDSVGNLISITDVSGSTTIYSYDLLGRFTSETNPDDTTTYTYDAHGNMLSAGNSTITFSMTYDVKNRLLSRTDSNGRAVGYTYDALGRRVTMTDAGGNVTTYTYDADSKLLSTSGFAGLFGFSYDATGRRVAINYPTPAVKNYTFDLSGRLASISQTNSAASFMEENYTYDGVGNILTRTRLGDTTRSYLYDSLYRVTGEGMNEAYSYDAVGNRLTAMSYFGGNGEYTYDAANRITTPGFIYDVKGNLTTKQSFAPILEEPPADKPGRGTNSGYAAGKKEDKLGPEISSVRGRAKFAFLREFFLPSPRAHERNRGRFSWVNAEGVGALTAVAAATEGTTATATIIGYEPTTTTSYEYDSDDRLKGVIFEGGTIAFKYGPFGRLINIVIDKAGVVTNKMLFYDRNDVIARYDETGALVAR